MRTGTVVAVVALSLATMGAAFAKDPAPQAPGNISDAVRSIAAQGRAIWDALPTGSAAAVPLPPPKVVRPGQFSHMPPVTEVESPDRLRMAGTRDGNLYVRSRTDDTMQVLASADAAGRWDIEGALWSPNSASIAVRKVDDAAVPLVTLNGKQFGP